MQHALLLSCVHVVLCLMTECIALCGCTVVAEVASVLLGFDMRQLNNATAFRKCWYRKSLSEAVLFGNRSAMPTELKSGICACSLLIVFFRVCENV